MNVLNDAAEHVFRIVLAISAEPRSKEMEERPEPFAARAEDVLADLFDEGNIGAQALMDPVLHAFHVGFVFF
jgi:hypothetical protein